MNELKNKERKEAKKKRKNTESKRKISVVHKNGKIIFIF